MAVKLYLPDGSRTDISAQTVPRFPVRTPDAFIALVKAGRPGPSRLWRLPLFLATHPEALPALRAGAAGLKPPASYASRRYYALHAFKWVDADGGERWVRYRWLPEADEATISSDEAKSRGRDYLQDELRARLEREPVRFTLELQIAADGDSTDDPTAVWPDDRERVTAGTLEVTGLETDRETGGDVLVFDPTRVVDGIELSDDPILNYRPRAYSASIERRSGEPPPDRVTGA
jgi:catalase